jgi:hypothetical protein
VHAYDVLHLTRISGACELSRLFESPILIHVDSIDGSKTSFQNVVEHLCQWEMTSPESALAHAVIFGI